MFTNDYLPQVGGVAYSIDRIKRSMENRGHEVLVVAPGYDGATASDSEVERVPSVRNFNGSDFSLALPFAGRLHTRVREFAPDVIHTHHPFLLGNTGLRAALKLKCPVVFTHHTMYEHYTHYVPLELPVMKRYVRELSTGYANMCNAVIAPSESIACILRGRGVKTAIESIPTGVERRFFSSNSRTDARNELGLPSDCFVVGHVGRLAREKNLEYLARAQSEFLRRHRDVFALIVGTGAMGEGMRRIFAECGVEERVRMPGKLTGEKLLHAYRAMDVFAFASQSETQGMVLLEAMATGCPVVALDANGVRDVVEDERNGFLLDSGAGVDCFKDALERMLELDDCARKRLAQACRETAGVNSLENCVQRILNLYSRLIAEHGIPEISGLPELDKLMYGIMSEWDIWANRLNSLGRSLDILH